MRLSYLLLFTFGILTRSIPINTDYIADDPKLENYFVTYVNGTKVITPLSDIRKKFLK